MSSQTSSEPPSAPWYTCCDPNRQFHVGQFTNPVFTPVYALCALGRNGTGPCVYGTRPDGSCITGATGQVQVPIAQYWTTTFNQDVAACAGSSSARSSSRSSVRSRSASSHSASMPVPFACTRYIPSVPTCSLLTPATDITKTTVFLWPYTQAQCSGQCPGLQNLVACCDPTAGCRPLDFQRCTDNGFASVSYPTGGLNLCKNIFNTIGC